MCGVSSLRSRCKSAIEVCESGGPGGNANSRGVSANPSHCRYIVVTSDAPAPTCGCQSFFLIRGEPKHAESAHMYTQRLFAGQTREPCRAQRAMDLGVDDSLRSTSGFATVRTVAP